MACPVCGSTEPERDGTCPACGSPADGATVYPADADATVLPSRAEADPRSDADGATMLPVGDGETRLPGDDGATIMPAAGATPRPPSRAAQGATGRRLGSSDATGPLAVGQDFGSRYHILKTLGVGGMGAVYQAWDAELSVAVAVKVIRPEALQDPQQAQELERRFKRELLLARQVTHKNVVRIHDLGEIEGIKYITMSYVEGEDVATALRREGKLPVARVLRIARQVVSAMQAAHEAGVVHRDLKPANIMLDRDDNALIMDFGIALSSGKPGGGAAGAPRPPTLPAHLAAASDGSETMMSPATPPPAVSIRPTRAGTILSTQAGGIVGTLEYMAPEQSRGEDVDQRTDIYAFGFILADLLLGPRMVPPGSNAWKELTTRISTAPVPLRTKDPGLPDAIDTLVTKCVQIDPADRFQTTAELAAALDRIDADGNLIPEPVVRRFTPRIAAAAAVLVAALVVGTYWLARGPAQPPAAPKPVSVLIADFANKANDPVFDGLIEQALAVGVEGASFVTAYPRRDALRLAAQIKPGGHLDDGTAVLVAMREGVERVIAGSIAENAGTYTLNVRMVDPTTNKDLLTFGTEAKGKDAVLTAVGKIAARIREGLGDRTASSDKVRAEETFTAGSLEAARAYTSGQELQWAGKYEEAAAEYQKAIKLDPSIGRAYSGLGAVTSSLGRRDEADGYYKQALAQSGRMTEREKFRTRGGYYLLQRNSDKALEEFKALVDKYPADTAGLANLALAYFYRRDMPRAVTEGRRAVSIYPKNVLRRNNLALFAMYASDFETAEREAGEVLKLNPAFVKAFVAQGLSQLALGRADAAAATYGKLEQVSDAGRSNAASGLADLAMYQGRLADAAGILEPAIKAEKDASRQARLMVTLGEARNLQGRPRDAIDLARKALSASKDEGVAFLAGRVLSDAGQTGPALEIVTKLLERLDPESLMYARVLEGEVALKKNDPRKAIARFKTAQQFADSWLVRFGLGRAYLQADAAAEADSEFDLCVKRRGEAAAALLDDVPTYRFYAPVQYYRGRVQEALGSPDAADSYKAFVAIKDKGDEQGLVADARRRLAASR